MARSADAIIERREPQATVAAMNPTISALIGSSALHALLYASFVWLAARAGSVFASQSAYFTTASGIVWAMVLLGERFSPWVWAAAAVMLCGLALVAPRERPSA